MEVNLTEQSEVEPHDLAMQLVPQLSTGLRFDLLLVADAPVDVLESDHRLALTPLSGPEWWQVLGTLSPAWTWRH